MRASILAAAPFVVGAFAQSSDVSTTVLSVSSGSTVVSSSYVYSNGFTSYLTETNSLGVVTGMPAVVTSQPSVAAGETTQPEVATIPAGLPAGINTIVVAAANTSANTFLVSVGSSTTVVVGGAVATDASVVTGASAGIASASVVTVASTDSAGSSITTSTTTGSGSATPTTAASASSSSGVAANVQIASGALLGLSAIMAAFL